MAKAKLDIRKANNGFSFYIDGSLQFNSQDEFIYHESLVIPPACILSERLKRPFNVLVLGGGDGLALRELLKFPNLGGVDLVDHDAEVLDLARGEFSPWNQNSMAHERVSVLCCDAAQYLLDTKKIYDLIISDLTFPSDLIGAHFFTKPFFYTVKDHLSSRGIFALNSISPSRSAPAYWSIFKTLRSLRMYSKPFRVDIPSFASQGYGNWGFFFASRAPILRREIKEMVIPFAAQYLNKGSILKGLKFPVSEVEFGLSFSKEILEAVDLQCLLNMPGFKNASLAEIMDFSHNFSSRQMRMALRRDSLLSNEIMAEWSYRTLKTLESLDWEAFFEEVEKILRNAPARLVEEFNAFKKEFPDFLKNKVFTAESAFKFFSVLLIMIIFVNTIYPDNTFAKGGGYYGGGYGGGGTSEFVLAAGVPQSYFHGALFRSSSPLFVPDMRGGLHKKSGVNFIDNTGKVIVEKFFYALSDSISLTDAGHAYAVLPPALPYNYRIEKDRFILLHERNREPVFEFAPDPEILQSLSSNLSTQRKILEKALADYDRWMSWASPASIVTHDDVEIKNLKALQQVILAASKNFADSAPSSVSQPMPMSRLAPGVYLSQRGSILLKTTGGWAYYAFRQFPAAPEFGYTVRNEDMDKYLEGVLSYHLAHSKMTPETKKLLMDWMAPRSAAGEGQK